MKVLTLRESTCSRRNPIGVGKGRTLAPIGRDLKKSGDKKIKDKNVVGEPIQEVISVDNVIKGSTPTSVRRLGSFIYSATSKAY